MERRNFLQSSSLGLSAALIASTSAQAIHTSERTTERTSERKIVLGIMGCSRGIGLFEDLIKIQNVEIKYLCDCDQARLSSAMKTAEKSDQKPLAVSDFRHILDDKSVVAEDPGLLAQPIRSGHLSTHLCHLGNVAHRVGTVIKTSSDDGRWTDAAIPDEYWKREYAPEWETAIVS